MPNDPSFYWYDLETFGINNKYHRIAQFAGVRTDLELNIIEEPLVIYCRPSNDFLPDPRSCLVTGITPRIAAQKGVPEPDFISRIHQKFSKSNTCVVGYNNIRFDDEFMRYAFYRNMYDPYEREWKNGNSRWDIIDMVRGTYALRPEGINWPQREDGLPSFRLEELTKANGIEHTQAHDAYSDVVATINMAKHIRKAQPRLYDYMLNHRDKRSVAKLLDVNSRKAVVHISGMYKSANGCIGIVVPIVQHPINKNGIIVLSLDYDPRQLEALDVEEIRDRIYTPSEELPEGVERIPFKTVHLNKCPVIAPINTLTEEICQRYQFDLNLFQQRRDYLAQQTELHKKIRLVFNEKKEFPAQDVDESLYSGFFSNNDKHQMDKFRRSTPTQLAESIMPFDDPRLPELLFRYRARNFPTSLSEQEADDWEQFRIDKLHGREGNVPMTVDSFLSTIDELERSDNITSQQLEILKDLKQDLHTRLVVKDSLVATI